MAGVEHKGYLHEGKCQFCGSYVGHAQTCPEYKQAEATLYRPAIVAKEDIAGVTLCQHGKTDGGSECQQGAKEHLHSGFSAGSSTMVDGEDSGS